MRERLKKSFFLKISIPLAVLTVVFLLCQMEALLPFFGYVLAVITVICVLSGLVSALADKSPAVVFLIVDGVSLIGSVLFGWYDIATDTGFLAGIIGCLVLLFLSIPLGVLLVIDLIYLFVQARKRRKKQKEESPENKNTENTIDG